MSRAIARAFQGQERLYVVFWYYAVVGGILVSALTGFGLNVADSAGVRVVGVTVTALTVLAALVYYAWVLVSVWKCAFNVHRRFWGHIARVYAVVQAAAIFYWLFTTPWLGD